MSDQHTVVGGRGRQEDPGAVEPETWDPDDVIGRPLLADAGRPEDEDTESKAGDAGGKNRNVISWKDLPKKKQLFVIVLARLSEPLAQTSLQAYMFYQLKWFDPTQSDATIASQAGALHASFTCAQFLTAMVWGRAADSSRFGRKTVVLIGLLGTFISSIGYGFSTRFWQALLFRVLGGVTNGNVGVLRTMISETVREKKFQSRAFLLLPMTFNIGVIIGPVLGGVLSDLAGTYPSVFGNVPFFVKFPYAAPNLVSAFILFCGLVSTWLCLEETLESRLDKRDIGIEVGNKLSGLVSRLFSRFEERSATSDTAYVALASRDPSLDLDGPRSEAGADRAPPASPKKKAPGRRVARYTQRLPFRRIFTRNVVLTFFSQFLLAFHVGTFNSLWFVFLSTPVYDPSNPSTSPGAFPRRLPFFFSGGMGLQPRSVGMAMAILGVIGIALQLLVYPSLSTRLGTVRSLRLFLMCFPLTYFAVPYLSLVPSSSPPPHSKDGALAWAAIAAVLSWHVLGRTFSLPAQTILVNNCSPHPSVLGTVHGLGQSSSSFARSIGPAMCGFLYGLGLREGVVGAVWWGLSCVAVCGLLTSLWLREGNGHEIWLEGDEEDE